MLPGAELAHQEAQSKSAHVAADAGSWQTDATKHGQTSRCRSPSAAHLAANPPTSQRRFDPVSARNPKADLARKAPPRHCRIQELQNATPWNHFARPHDPDSARPPLAANIAGCVHAPGWSAEIPCAPSGAACHAPCPAPDRSIRGGVSAPTLQNRVIQMFVRSVSR